MVTKRFSVVLISIIVITLLAVFPSGGIVSASVLAGESYDIPASTTITIGETNILSLNDSGRGNFVIAQQVTLPESATLQSLSFYIATASGQLRLGVYNNSGNNPGTLVAQTAAFTPTVGWNTQDVITPVLLPAGTYWLAFLPQSNALQFKAEATGSARGFSQTFGNLPSTFSGSSQSAAVHYSFYTTLLIDTPSTSTSTNTPVFTETATNTALPSNTPTMTLTGTSTNVPAVTGTAINTALPSDTPTSTPTQTQTALPGGGEDLIHLSSANSGVVGGVSFADEDILVYNTATGAWSLYFDGSDVGLGGSDVDAFSILSDGSILLSMDTSISVGSLGTVADADIVRFIPTSLGDNTTGTFEWYFDGSDVGLTTSGEDIDAIDFAPDGKLVISTTDTFSVTGGTGDDEDLLVFTSIALGSTTGGTWGLYFDGSDVGLSGSSNEDMSGIWIDDTTGKLYLSTVGAFSVTGISGDGADIFICTPGTLGPTTECTYGPGLYWDGSANGFAGQVVDGFDIVQTVGGATSTPLPTSTATFTPTITTTNTSIPSTNTITPIPTLVPGAIRFAAVGDYGVAGQPELDVANLIKSWNPEFVITLGDNNYVTGSASTIDQNIGQYYQEFIFPYIGAYGPGGVTNRFFPSLGNHDWDTPNAQPYLNYFTLPGNERYYDFVKGPVHFFVVDSDSREPDGITSTSTQAIWLQNQLAASTSTWNVVYMHHPPYSSGDHGSNSILQWPYAAWGADVVLAGHDHNYERLFLNGIPYIVNGLGGRSVDPFGTIVSGSQVRYSSDYGAMLIDASESQIAFKFITRTGVLIDSYTLNSLPVATFTPTTTAIFTSTATTTPTFTTTFTPTSTATRTSTATATNAHTSTPTSTATIPGCTDPTTCSPVSGIPARWVCNIPGCTDPDWVGGVISWPSWAAYSTNARSGNQSRTVYSSSNGNLLYPYMGSWADGCEVTAVSGVALVIEWRRGTDTWRETLLEPGESHTIDLIFPEDGALIEGPPTGFSVSLANCNPQNIPPAPTPTTSIVTIGETNILGIDDAGNANLLVAQQAVLSQSATIQSMSFYVATAGGQLRLGIYSNAGNGPGTLLAQTPSFTPVVGWNTQNVQTPVLLPAGTYWLAFLPQSSSMHYRAQTTGSARGVSYTFGAMPSTYPGSPMSATVHWSLYATLTR